MRIFNLAVSNAHWRYITTGPHQQEYIPMKRSNLRCYIVCNKRKNYWCEGNISKSRAAHNNNNVNQRLLHQRWQRQEGCVQPSLLLSFKVGILFHVVRNEQCIQAEDFCFEDGKDMGRDQIVPGTQNLVGNKCFCSGR